MLFLDLKNHQVFNDMTFLNVIFINQLHYIKQTNCKTWQCTSISSSPHYDDKCWHWNLYKYILDIQPAKTNNLHHSVWNRKRAISSLLSYSQVWNKAKVPNTKITWEGEKMSAPLRSLSLKNTQLYTQSIWRQHAVLFSIKFMLWTILLTVYWLLNTVNDLIRPRSN